MADDYNKSDTTCTEDNESGDDEQAITDDFRYMPLEDGDENNMSDNEEESPDAGNSSPHNCHPMQTSRSSRSGYYSSGCESSDVEAIQESSSSIEMLEPDKLDNVNYPGEKENENYNQNVERLCVDNEGAAMAAPIDYEDKPNEVKLVDMIQGDSASQQDSLNSETATLRSSSSTCSNLAGDEPMDMPGSMHGGRPHHNNLEAEAREIFAAIDALDRDHSVSSISPDSSSLSASPFNSPGHPPLMALEPNIVTLENGLSDRPDSLSLPRPLQYYEKRRLMKKDSSASSLSELSSRSSSMDALIEAAMSTPLQSQGVVTTEGEMVAFVASGLDHMIRMSSPMSRNTDSGNMTPRSMVSMSSSASGWSTSSASGWSYSGLSRSPSVLTQSPDDIPPIDPRALMDLEVHARNVATSLDNMMLTLKKNLFKMSSITCGCVDAYKTGVDNTCDSVDAGIKSMYALMAKCEELSKRMGPIYKLQKEIQDIKRLLGMFEAQLSRDEKKT